MSRFLIRPEVHCHNLASLLLGQILRNVPNDYEHRLGDKRLSERLVECASAKAKIPDRSFTGVAKGDWPAVKGYLGMEKTM